MEKETICAKFGSEFVATDPGQKVGVSLDTKTGRMPLNGLRRRPASGFSGWFLWAGPVEPSTKDDFFKPLHAHHLEQWAPIVIPYLALAPGWRFLIAPDYEDVWFDPSLFEN